MTSYAKEKRPGGYPRRRPRKRSEQGNHITPQDINEAAFIFLGTLALLLVGAALPGLVM